jgi:hypothetical protein
MTEITAGSIERPRRLHLDWVLPLLRRPRAIFAQMAERAQSAWLTPLLILTLTGLVLIAAAGPIKTAAAQSGVIELPDEAQWWTPEQQAAFMQAQQATTGPVFIYVFPAILAVLGVWVGWLVVAGMLHLLMTLLGGRDTTAGALNIVAWASLPFALRDLVRIAFMLVTKQLVTAPGLAGFAPQGEGIANALLGQALRQVDVYGLWFVALLFIGVRASNGLSPRKAALGVGLTVLVALVLLVLPGVISSQLGGGPVIRPFLF